MTIELRAKQVVEDELKSLQATCRELKQRGVVPQLKVILVGEDPASVIYTNKKQKFCEKFGALCEIVRLPNNLPEADFIQQIKSISSDNNVHGCFVQLPLPDHLKHIDAGKYIPAYKDVDGFCAENLCGLLSGDKGEEFLLPCTPLGIITLLNAYKIPIAGKSVVVIGRSLIVGKPATLLMNNHNATVTLCHSHTKDLQSFTKQADIIVVAIGSPEFIDEKYIDKDRDQVIVDVGVNRKDDGKICGDVNYAAVRDSVAAITPVPGGVGPMTVLSLAKNLVQAAKRQTGN